MSDTKKHEITSKEGKRLLKQIEKELPRIKLGPEDIRGNREYEPNKTLDDEVKQLLVHLQLGVRNNGISVILQLLNIGSILDTRCGGYRTV